MENPLLRRSFLASCMAPGAVGFFGFTPEAKSSFYVATHPEWKLKPGATEDQSAALQTLIDTVSKRGGGTVFLPFEHNGLSGSYRVQDIRPSRFRNGTRTGPHFFKDFSPHRHRTYWILRGYSNA